MKFPYPLDTEVLISLAGLKKINNHIAASDLVGVVAEGDVIVVIGEGDDTLAVCLGHGEEVPQDVLDAFAQSRLQIMEDEVRVLLRHGPDVGDVVPHHNVRHIEIGRRSVRQVADDQCVRLAAVLVHHHEIRNAVGPARRQQLLQLVVACVFVVRFQREISIKLCVCLIQYTPKIRTVKANNEKK